MNLAIYWVHIYWVQRFFELLAGNRVHARLPFWAQMDLKKGGFYVTRVTALSKVALCCTALFMWFYLAAKLRYGLMVSHALVFGSSGPSPRPGRRHYSVLEEGTLLSQCLSPPMRVYKLVLANSMLGASGW